MLRELLSNGDRSPTRNSQHGKKPWTTQKSQNNSVNPPVKTPPIPRGAHRANSRIYWQGVLEEVFPLVRNLRAFGEGGEQPVAEPS